MLRHQKMKKNYLKKLVGHYLSYQLGYLGYSTQTTFQPKEAPMIHFLAYLIVYLLLALAFDLLHELFCPRNINRRYGAIRRRLWSDTAFDCRSLVFSADTPPCKRGRRCRSATIRSAALT